MATAAVGLVRSEVFVEELCAGLAALDGEHGLGWRRVEHDVVEFGVGVFGPAHRSNAFCDTPRLLWPSPRLGATDVIALVPSARTVPYDRDMWLTQRLANFIRAVFDPQTEVSRDLVVRQEYQDRSR